MHTHDPSIQSLRQDDFELEANLGYPVRSRPAIITQARDAGVCCGQENHAGSTYYSKLAPNAFILETRYSVAQAVLKLIM